MSADQGTSALRIKIGVLSLRGVTRAQGAAIAASLQSELRRLLGGEAARRQLRDGAALVSGAIPALDAGRMMLRPGERAERTGARIGAQVAGGLLGMAAAPRAGRP
jgi:hypothetical protein